MEWEGGNGTPSKIGYETFCFVRGLVGWGGGGHICAKCGLTEEHDGLEMRVLCETLDKSFNPLQL